MRQHNGHFTYAFIAIVFGSPDGQLARFDDEQLFSRVALVPDHLAFHVGSLAAPLRDGCEISDRLAREQ